MRKPLPSPDEIARLPADGGQEFNRLIFATSPYLLQHARNPVDWYPWGEAAFARAAAEDKPVFLSIGYATCHWCGVMEADSFEREDVAELLNGDFVAVKVDREERPDVDELYMAATLLLRAGFCRTSRRRSTTTRSSRARTPTAFASPVTRRTATRRQAPATGCCARWPVRAGASSAASMPTAMAVRTGSTSGRARRSTRCSAPTKARPLRARTTSSPIFLKLPLPAVPGA